MNNFYKQLIFITLGVAIIASGILITVAVNNRGADPVLWLKFDEGYASTTHDASGSNDGTMYGGVHWKNEPECYSGKCLYFDGENDYVSIPDFALD